MTLDEARTLLETHGIHTVECAFPDTQGHMRGKRVPTAHFLRSTAEKGFANADAAFYWDVHCELFEMPHYDPAVDIVDMIVIPDLSTLRPITWREGTAICLCNCISEHSRKPIPMDPRHLLRLQVERARALGFEPVVATEIEFYLLDQDWKPLYETVQCYSLAKSGEYEGVISDIRRTVESFGIVVEASNMEYGPAQVEINMGREGAVEVADSTMIFKNIVKEVALRHGYRTTFMAKPFNGASGNGLHLHGSLERDGVNVYAERTDDEVLNNELMRRFVAGLCVHMPEMSLIANPSVNAYKRIEDYSFAPTNVSWGHDNRNVAVRCIPQAGGASRIEYRGAAADANPYLAIAAMLGAGLNGIERSLELPPAAETDAYADSTQTRLPRTLMAAVDVFEQGSFARDVFGPVFAANYAAIARREGQLYDAHVTEWEFKRYAEYA